jgi:hypothetical protein
MPAMIGTEPERVSRLGTPAESKMMPVDSYKAKSHLLIATPKRPCGQHRLVIEQMVPAVHLWEAEGNLG